MIGRVTYHVNVSEKEVAARPPSAELKILSSEVGRPVDVSTRYMRSSLAPLLPQPVGCQIERDGAEGVGEGLKTVMLDDRAEASFNRAFIESVPSAFCAACRRFWSMSIVVFMYSYLLLM
jgi:hypothetical protein